MTPPKTPAQGGEMCTCGHAKFPAHSKRSGCVMYSVCKCLGFAPTPRQEPDYALHQNHEYEPTMCEVCRAEEASQEPDTSEPQKPHDIFGNGEQLGYAPSGPGEYPADAASQPRRYRKKPVVVEAVQFTGNNFQEITRFTGTSRLFRPAPEHTLRETPQHFPYEPGVVAEIYDYLHESWVGVKANHWIIKGISGEFYPCEPETFEATYEAV